MAGAACKGSQAGAGMCGAAQCEVLHLVQSLTLQGLVVPSITTRTVRRAALGTGVHCSARLRTPAGSQCAAAAVRGSAVPCLASKQLRSAAPRRARRCSAGSYTAELRSAKLRTPRAAPGGVRSSALGRHALCRSAVLDRALRPFAHVWPLAFPGLSLAGAALRRFAVPGLALRRFAHVRRCALPGHSLAGHALRRLTLRGLALSRSGLRSPARRGLAVRRSAQPGLRRVKVCTGRAPQCPAPGRRAKLPRVKLRRALWAP